MMSTNASGMLIPLLIRLLYISPKEFLPPTILTSEIEISF